MLASRVLSRVSRSVCRSSLLNSASQKHHLPILSTQFHSLVSDSWSKLLQSEVPPFDHSKLNSSTLQRFGFSSSASPETNEKETGASVESGGDSPNAKPGQVGASDSEAESDFSSDDLVKLVAEKDALLKAKDTEILEMKDKVLRVYAEMENVMDRTRRQAESSKKFAIQSFAKDLLDVADNLGRASSVVKDGFSKIDTSRDTSGAVPLLKTLLEGVEMTEKQLNEVFRKFGVEKYDPMNEPFDPHRHNAMFQIPDNSKPPGTIAAVLKPGYALYDRVIRPAEVGVTKEA